MSTDHTPREMTDAEFAIALKKEGIEWAKIHPALASWVEYAGERLGASIDRETKVREEERARVLLKVEPRFAKIAEGLRDVGPNEVHAPSMHARWIAANEIEELLATLTSQAPESDKGGTDDKARADTAEAKLQEIAESFLPDRHSPNGWKTYGGPIATLDFIRKTVLSDRQNVAEMGVGDNPNQEEDSEDA